MTATTETKTKSWPFWLWVAAVVLLAFIGTVVVTAWAVRYAMTDGKRFSRAQTELVLDVAKFLGQVKMAFDQTLSTLIDEPTLLLIEKKAAERPSWQRHFPEAQDPGYLLFSGVDPVVRRSIVSLIRIADGKVQARWLPDWAEIIKRTGTNKNLEEIAGFNIRAFHPILLPDGDVIFNTTGAMVRMGVCNAKPVWVLDEVMHHSNELDSDGNIWTPSVSSDGSADTKWLRARVRDDAIAKVSPDGKLLERRSFSNIMRDNGLLALLLGSQGFRLHDDPIHLNQITVAPNTTEHWQRGDLLISARHLSTLFLYRPTTGKIIWHQTGPWMNQHSVAFVGDHQISVFNNNVYGNAANDQPFVSPGDINQVMVFDFKTQQVSQPFVKLLSESKPLTFTEGRAQLLPDGGLFVEESNFGRHLRFTKDKLLWSRVNDYDERRIGLVSWSRYLTAAEVEQPLKSLARRECLIEVGAS